VLLEGDAGSPRRSVVLGLQVIVAPPRAVEDIVVAVVTVVTVVTVVIPAGSCFWEPAEVKHTRPSSSRSSPSAPQPPCPFSPSVPTAAPRPTWALATTHPPTAATGDLLSDAKNARRRSAIIVAASTSTRDRPGEITSACFALWLALHHKVPVICTQDAEIEI